MSKKKRNSEILHHQQMFAQSFVHPDCKVIIPVMPEIIRNRDGKKTTVNARPLNDSLVCSVESIPTLKLLLSKALALASNGPHIRELQRLNLRFILGAKLGDHATLFQHFLRQNVMAKFGL
jgi:hypothetical protein